jgi:hypothetical protein
MITETPPPRSVQEARPPRKRTPLVIGALVFVIAGLAWILQPPRETAIPVPAAPTPAPEPPTKTITDGPEIFRRAFWKRATADNKILHAERREWSNSEGLQKWQWFLVVEPSRELLHYLREENAFGMTTDAPLPTTAETPEWFAFDSAEFDTARARTGNMRVSFHRTKPLLFATDFGSGFTTGAKLPAAKPTTISPQPEGRLPRTSPPTSSK